MITNSITERQDMLAMQTLRLPLKRNKLLLTKGWKKAVLFLLLALVMVSSFSPNPANDQLVNIESIVNSIGLPDGDSGFIREYQYPMVDSSVFNPPKYTGPLLVDEPSINIQSNVDFQKFGFPGKGTAEDPFIIEGLNLVQSKKTLLSIQNTDAWVIIRNNIFDGEQLSPGHFYTAIYLAGVLNVKIESNSISHVNYGIVVDDTSQNVDLTANRVASTDYGITIARSSAFNTISGNTIVNTRQFAIFLTGVDIDASASNTMITKNIIRHATIGIYVVSSDANSIVENEVTGTKTAGIVLDSSKRNVVEANVISSTQTQTGIIIETLFNPFVSIYANSLGLNVIDGRPGVVSTTDGKLSIRSASSSSSSHVDPLTTDLVEPHTHSLSRPVLLYPLGEETLTGEVVVSWTAARDSFGHPVYYALYLQDEYLAQKKSWMRFAANITDTSYKWDTSTVENGFYRLYVQAYDGYELISYSDASYYFLITNNQHTLFPPTIVYPNNGEVVSGTITVDWNDASDSAEHSVVYDLFLSADNGLTWTTLAKTLTVSQFDLSTRYLLADKYYSLLVRAYDEFGLQSEDTTDVPFTVSHDFASYLYYLTSNDDFARYKIPGAGTVEDPYTLAGFNFSDSSRGFVYAESTTAFFTIQDNHIDGIYGSFPLLTFVNTANIHVTRNNITNGQYGIQGINSTTITITSNAIYSNVFNGISFTETFNSVIDSNIISDNGDIGISLENSSFNTINANTVNGNGFSGREIAYTGSSKSNFAISGLVGSIGSGIFLDPSTNNIISNNIVFENVADGVLLLESAGNQIEGNALFANGFTGISIVNSSKNAIQSNDIYNNGFSLLGQLSSFARASLRGLSGSIGSGIFLDPSSGNIIAGNNVFNNGVNGVFFENSSGNVITNNNVFRNGIGTPAGASFTGLSGSIGSGIFLDPSNDNSISNNIVFENGIAGIQLLDSDHVTITGNSVYANVGSGSTLIDSNSNILSGNYFFDNGFEFSGGQVNGASMTTLSGSIGSGIFLDPSNDNVIENNIINNNAQNGVFLENSDNNRIASNIIYNNGLGAPTGARASESSGSIGSGIFLDPSEHNIIENNTIFSNGIHGIHLLESRFTTIRQNSVYGNTENGLASYNSSYGHITGNYFFNNGFGVLGKPIGAERNELTGNIASGIFLDPSEGNVIEFNVINNNGYTGVFLDRTTNSQLFNNTIDNNGQIGVFLYFSDSNNISKNWIANNGNGTIAQYTFSNNQIRASITKLAGSIGSGIFLDPSNNNYIAHNVFLRNGGYGVSVDVESAENTATLNDFINNNFANPENSQIYDDGTNTTFASNFYSDADPFEPYPADGSAGTEDKTPLRAPVNYPQHKLSAPKILFPKGGEVLSGVITLKWKAATDSWGHKVSYIVLWTYNNGYGHGQGHGHHWKLLAYGLTNTSLEIDTTKLHNGNNNRFIVVAMDGEGLFTFDISGVFKIKNTGRMKQNYLVAENNELNVDTNTDTVAGTELNATANLDSWTALLVVASISLSIGLRKVYRKTNIRVRLINKKG